MSHEAAMHTMQLYKHDGYAIIGIQPPLASEHVEALDGVLTPCGPIGETGGMYDEHPDVGDSYTELTWPLKGDEVIHPDRMPEVIAGEIVDILRDRGLTIEFAGTIEDAPEGRYLFGSRRFTHEEYLLQEFGISPAIARLWLKSAFDMTPEDIRQANPMRHGNHDIEAFVRIALGGQPLYMLHDVYLDLHAEIEAEENMDSSGRSINQALLGWRSDEFRDQSSKLIKRFKPVAELMEFGISEAEFAAIELAKEQARQSISEMSPEQQAIGVTTMRRLLIVDELSRPGMTRVPEGYEGVSFVIWHAEVGALAAGDPLTEERLTHKNVHQVFMGEPVTLNTTLGDIAVPMFSRDRQKVTVDGQPIVELTKDSYLAIKSE